MVSLAKDVGFWGFPGKAGQMISLDQVKKTHEEMW